jgi:hypothetical protein
MTRTQWILLGLFSAFLVAAAILLAIFIPKKPLNVYGVKNIPAGTYLTATAKLNATIPSGPAQKTAAGYSLAFQPTPTTLTETGYLIQGVACAQDSQGALHILFYFNKISSQGVVTTSAFSRKQWNSASVQPEFTLTTITPQSLLFDMANISLEVCTASTTILSVYSSQLALQGTLDMGHTITNLNFDTASYIFVLCNNGILFRVSNNNGSLSSTSFATGVSSYQVVGNTLVVQLSSGVVNLYAKENGIWTMTSSSPVTTGQTLQVYTTNAGKVIAPNTNGLVQLFSYFGGAWSTTNIALNTSDTFPFRCTSFQSGYEEAVVYTESNSLYFQKLNSQETRQALFSNFFEQFKYPASVAIGIHNRIGDQAAYVVVAYAKGYVVGQNGAIQVMFGVNNK